MNAFDILVANFLSFFITQLSPRRLFRESLKKKSASFRAVLSISLAVSKVKMIRSYTLAIIACMKNEAILGILAMMNHPGNPIGSKLSFFVIGRQRHNPVAIFVRASIPNPTSFGFCETGKEPFPKTSSSVTEVATVFLSTLSSFILEKFATSRALLFSSIRHIGLHVSSICSGGVALAMPLCPKYNGLDDELQGDEVGKKGTA